MKRFAYRIHLSLLTGYVFLYYGEIVFWATPDRQGMGMGGLLSGWLLYSCFAYAFLCVVSVFRVRNGPAMFLAGAVFGWSEEGIFLQTTYGSPDTPFPISISFTALAWHALIDALVGWYLVRTILARNLPARAATLAVLIGGFYGLWAIFWWTEPPDPMRLLFESGRKDLILLHFATYSFATTSILIVVLWLFDRNFPHNFVPSKVECWFLIVVSLVYFAFVTVRAAPRALWVLPPLLGVTFVALNRNRRAEQRPDAIVGYRANRSFICYLALLLIPLVAVAIYALALGTDIRWRTNLVAFYSTSLIGAGLWVWSVWTLLALGAERRYKR